ncbi:hypothetical protein NDU88_000968 [Pleurodeles waltl]|uniref:Uncharacterized protein n=1 Tax=Pleurodeles waltl TaxID=8319 RepID=A0AAV7MID0_PLEWA|nr:hypothetical protein NDU88_000968 [Pleurodeles waltl]
MLQPSASTSAGHCGFALRISVQSSAPPRVPRTSRHQPGLQRERPSELGAAAADPPAPQLFQRGATLLQTLQRPATSTAWLEGQAPVGGCRSAGPSALTSSSSPRGLVGTSEAPGRSGPMGCRLRRSATSGPGLGQQSLPRRGEAESTTAEAAAFSLTLASRGTAPEGSAGVEPLLLPLSAIRLRHRGCVRLPRPAPPFWSLVRASLSQTRTLPLSASRLPGFLNGQGTSQGRQAVV